VHCAESVGCHGQALFVSPERARTVPSQVAPSTLSAVQAAPGMVVQAVYPVQGNEVSIGRDLLNCEPACAQQLRNSRMRTSPPEPGRQASTRDLADVAPPPSADTGQTSPDLRALDMELILRKRTPVVAGPYRLNQARRSGLRQCLLRTRARGWSAVHPPRASPLLLPACCAMQARMAGWDRARPGPLISFGTPVSQGGYGVVLRLAVFLPCNESCNSAGAQARFASPRWTAQPCPQELCFPPGLQLWGTTMVVARLDEMIQVGLGKARKARR
jgi:hypothetical protein